jgi:ABC-type nickel/cobalt efflux system permease component RcnA
VTWRSILALGISGGLLPCPSALVVLLSAIALGRVGFGLVLVLVFSVGLAAVLTGIGLTLVYAGRLFQKLPADNRLLRLIPAASALFITLAGLGITWQAVAQLRWLG